MRRIAYQSLLIKREDWATWTDEASAAYEWYVSIAEEGTSPRARFSTNSYKGYLPPPPDPPEENPPPPPEDIEPPPPCEADEERLLW